MSSKYQLTARMETFDSFWEAPSDIEKGYSSFAKFYKRNYLKHLPRDTSARILIISCGPGYFVSLLKSEGYQNVLGIDSFPDKIAYAVEKGLNCVVADGFDFLENEKNSFDVIIAEQEINHLTKAEMQQFLLLCRNRLSDGGTLMVHSLNGANPITGSEALAQNFDHYNTLTEYSLKQVLEHTGYQKIRVFPLSLYIFYENPLNYIGLVLDTLMNVIFRLSFVFYGKGNKLFSKKIGSICQKPHP